MPHVMRCHYEVLEVERNSDPDTLKKQYRKMALKVGNKQTLVFYCNGYFFCIFFQEILIFPKRLIPSKLR